MSFKYLFIRDRTDVRVLREFRNNHECRRESIGLILTEDRRVSFKKNMVGGENGSGDTDGFEFSYTIWTG